MKKLIAFIGSPRKNGNISSIIEEIVRGAREAGAEAKIYTVNDMNITPCQSCFYCRKEETCAIKDDMQSVYEDIKDVDAVVIGSPVYMMQVTAQTKLLFDRLYPLFDSSFKPRFGIKKTIVVYSQGSPDADAFKTSFETNANALNLMGLNVVDTIISTGAIDAKISSSNENLMAKAFQVGKKLFE